MAKSPFTGNVRPIDPARLRQIFEPDLYEQLRKAMPPRTFRDDLADLLDDIRANPELAMICAVGGLVIGMGATVGLAAVISVFL